MNPDRKNYRIVTWLGILGIAVTGCSIKMEDHTKVRVALPQRNGSFARLDQSTHSNFFSAAYPSPSDLDSFNCYGLNVMGPGIPSNPDLASDTDCARGDDSIYPGVLAGFSPVEDGFVDIDVPDGVDRVFQLIGIQSNVGCPALDQLILPEIGSQVGFPYELGRSVADVSGDMTVSIQALWDSDQPKRVFCGLDGSGVPAAIFLYTEKETIVRGQCTPVVLVIIDRFGNPVPLSFDLPLDLSVPTLTSAYGLNDLRCEGETVSSVTIPAAEKYVVFYLRTQKAVGSDLGLSAGVPGTEEVASVLKLKVVAE